MQRLHESDLAGHLLKNDPDNWLLVSIPTIYTGEQTFDAGRDIGRPKLNDPRTKKGQLVFPERMNKAFIKRQMTILGEYGFAGQHQQRPTPAGGGIIKKHWWRRWPDDEPMPYIEHQFSSWDTAFSTDEHKKAAHSARTRWGVFWHEQRERWCMICLGMWHGQVGYDELRQRAKDEDKRYNLDCSVIEKKATGISLYRDLRMALPGKVRGYDPGTGAMLGHRGEDKIARTYAASPLFESGCIYIPDREWADLLINYVAAFPNGSPPSADLTDTCTMAVIYLKNGHWVNHPDDDDEPEPVNNRDEDDEAAYQEDNQEADEGIYG